MFNNKIIRIKPLSCQHMRIIRTDTDYAYPTESMDIASKRRTRLVRKIYNYSIKCTPSSQFESHYDLDDSHISGNLV